MPPRSKRRARAPSDASENGPPTDIDPYETLNLKAEATTDQVKKAYRKMALLHHPDKAADDAKEAATQKFQQIAFAYAVLSDPRRRARYDATGSTSESLLDEGADGEPFNWTDFYRKAFAESVTTEKVEAFSVGYKNSSEEANDVLVAYERAKGDMDGVYESVMLSNVLEDDDRFRSIIQQAIDEGKATAFDAYLTETDASKQNRVRIAEREMLEAEKEAKRKAKKAGGKGNAKHKSDSDADLMSMIKSRQASRDAQGFLANLEAKYAPKSAKGRRKRAAEPTDEPPEEAFAATAERAKKARTRK